MSAPTPSQAVPEPVQAMPFQAVPYPARSVPFPADLLDLAMPILTDTEWRLLCVIVRQTLGWQNEDGGRKRRDWLTQDQLAGRTGRSRRAVSGAVESLVSKGMIRVQTEAGEPLDTPEARRGYGGRHWFLLRLPRQAPNLQAPNFMQAPNLQTAESQHGQEPEQGREGMAELPKRARADTALSHAETSHEETSHEETSHRDAKDAQAKEKTAQAKEKTAEKNLPTTKESLNKRNSFSEAEPRMGSASEEALSSEKSAYDRSTYAKSADGIGLAESAYEEAPQIVEEAPQIVGKSSQPESLPAETSQKLASPDRTPQEVKSQEVKSQEGTPSESGPKRTQSLLPPTSATSEGTTSEGTTLEERAARKTAAGAEYLRRLVEAGAVDYDEVRRFLLNYLDACRKLFPQQEAPSLAWGREGKLVAEMLGRHPYERLLRLLNRFLNRTDLNRTDLNRTRRQQPHEERSQRSLPQRSLPQRSLPQRSLQLDHMQQHDHTLIAFAQAIPDMIAQGRQDVGQGVQRAPTNFPIVLWHEEGAMTIHGGTSRMIREEGQNQEGQRQEGPNQEDKEPESTEPESTEQAAKPADNATTRWTWHKKSAQWRQG